MVDFFLHVYADLFLSNFSCVSISLLHKDVGVLYSTRMWGHSTRMWGFLLHKDVRFFTPQGCEDSLLHEDVSSLHEHMSLLHKDVRGGEKNRNGRHNGERCEDDQTEPGKYVF